MLFSGEKNKDAVRGVALIWWDRPNPKPPAQGLLKKSEILLTHTVVLNEVDFHYQAFTEEEKQIYQH